MLDKVQIIVLGIIAMFLYIILKNRNNITNDIRVILLTMLKIGLMILSLGLVVNIAFIIDDKYEFLYFYILVISILIYIPTSKYFKVYMKTGELDLEKVSKEPYIIAYKYCIRLLVFGIPFLGLYYYYIL